MKKIAVLASVAAVVACVAFAALEGKPHGGVCYENEAFINLVFGKR